MRVESIHRTDYIAGLEDVGFDMLPGDGFGGSAFPVGPLNPKPCPAFMFSVVADDVSLEEKRRRDF